MLFGQIVWVDLEVIIIWDMLVHIGKIQIHITPSLNLLLLHIVKLLASKKVLQLFCHTIGLIQLGYFEYKNISGKVKDLKILTVEAIESNV